MSRSSVLKENRSSNYFIPVQPALSPGLLAHRQKKELPFPFSHPRYYDYYFGRSAVWHGIKSLGLTARDRILFPSYHHGVEAEAILHAGLKIDFYRINTRMEIDLEDLKKKIVPSTRVLYLIYYLGFPHPVQEILRLCREHRLMLVEDCALSLFSQVDGAPMGSLGDLSIFSFHKTLPLPNGGGLVITQPDRWFPPRRIDPPIVSTLSHLTGGLMNRLKMEHPKTGRVVHAVSKEVVSAVLKVGGVQRTSVANMEFNTEKTGWGMASISKRILRSIDPDQVIARRRENFTYLLQHLDLKKRFVVDSLPAGACPLFFPILVDDKKSAYRDLMARGIETVDFWGISHPATPRGVYGEVEYLRAHLLEVPIHQDLHKEHLDYMIQTLRETLR
ncbi:MAG TPA: aminotransferase class V-fold PLP-dependent enzyme [Candidatus Manganitrophaceae bacterium]|nr:aminotransferase class V-fold PLP-dependent enzyme [Candidatus Manganitrophaceae bacterium]